MSDGLRCPDCDEVIHAIVCRGPNPKPLTDEARQELAELLIAVHKKMGGCTS